MNTNATSMNASARDDVYNRLARRNSVVAVMRIGVPIIGLIVLGLLIVQIVIANLGRDFGISGIRIARDSVVIDTPAYAGVMANGTQYKVAAETATTPLNGGDVIALDDAILDLVRPDGYLMKATADNASFSLVEQIVDVEELLIFTDSRNTTAQLRDTTIDWTTQTLVARDNVHIVFGDGSLLTASDLLYDAGQEIWNFRNVKLTLPAAEKAE